ncbi:MAG: putative dsRNA-binding protein [Candidatus Poribacteria bacterium]|nr:putative dsRNA-binding protein [Candidatus Poribacteria bacterium]
MSETATHTLAENYKGVFQQYCQKRGLGSPVYEVTQQGTPNEPSWLVTVKYGQATHTTSEPIRGSKRLAEQVAAKQILESVESRQETFLAGDSLDETAKLEALVDSVPETVATEPLYVPTELVTTALGIANHRLAELRRGTRYRNSIESKQTSEVFAQNLAELTITIVREVVNAAEASNVKFDNAQQPETSATE